MQMAAKVRAETQKPVGEWYAVLDCFHMVPGHHRPGDMLMCVQCTPIRMDAIVITAQKTSGSYWVRCPKGCLNRPVGLAKTVGTVWASRHKGQTGHEAEVIWEE